MNIGLFNCLKEIEGEFLNFMMLWEVIVDIFVYILIGDLNIDEFKLEIKFLVFLIEYLFYLFWRNLSFDY